VSAFNCYSTVAARWRWLRWLCCCAVLLNFAFIFVAMLLPLLPQLPRVRPRATATMG